MSDRRGIAYLVGGGPGDPGLITVRGLEILRAADVIIHDRLIGKALLAEARRDAELIDVGKARGAHREAQQEIHELLIDRAHRGLCVVRLKGGDPFVFGRGFEEWSACREAGVECVVVPGVSSALAAPLAAGIAVTARGQSRSVALITAETASGDRPFDAADLTRIDTLVVLMGRSKLSEITCSLMQVGKAPSTPAACIERATTPQQRVVCGTLATIAELAAREGLAAPMVTVIGEVALQAASQSLHALAPLVGRRVVITRPRAAARDIERALLAAGATVISCPLIRIAYPREDSESDEVLRDFRRFDWIAFTSRHGVIGFWKQLRALGLDARALSGCKLAAVGPMTASSLERFGLTADLIATRRCGEGLAEELLRAGNAAGKRVLFPRGDLALASLSSALRISGAMVEELVVYRTMRTPPPPRAVAELESGVDAILFFSPSAVRSFVEAKLVVGEAVIGCVGATTANAARELGLRVDLTAEDTSVQGFITALEEHFQEIGAPS